MMGEERSQSGGVRLRDYTDAGSLTAEMLRGGEGRKVNFDKVARGLIFASLGLGMLELIAPGKVQRMIGVRKGNYQDLIRFLGARELMSAGMIWMQSRPNTGVWARVAGDAMDLGLLGKAFTLRKAQKDRLTKATAFIAAVTAVDLLTAVMLTRQRSETKMLSALTKTDLKGKQPDGGFKVLRTVTINRSPEDVYRFWRNFENLPQFMLHLEAVEVLDDRRSHWVAKAPAGMQVAWDAEITEDVPNELIAWRSTENAQVPNLGVVRFREAPGGRGTEVQVEIEYHPPAGRLGRAVAKLFGEEPAQQVKGDLNRFKQVMETGEVVRSDGSPGGHGQKLQLPARPAPVSPPSKGIKGMLGKLLPGKRYSEEDGMTNNGSGQREWASQHTARRGG